MQAQSIEVWRFLSLLAVLVAAVPGACRPASAQSVPDPNSRQRQVETETAPYALRASTASRETRNFDPLDDSQLADIPPAIPRDDPSMDPDEQADGDEGDRRPRNGQRPVAEDGDLSFPQEPEPVQDGIALVGEPPASEDGVDPAKADNRTEGDAGVFEQPPAGYDPLLFQIEDLDPVRNDRRPERLAKLEPFDPVGVKVGSFVYFPELQVSGVATNNIMRSPKPESDTYADINSLSRLVSNWDTHALELRSTGLYSFHSDYPSEDDRAWGVEARGRLDVTKRTNVQALASYNVSQESRTAIDASTAGPRPNVATDTQEVALNHRFNRLSVQIRGTHFDTNYENVRDKGFLINNEERDISQNEGAVRLKWEFKPTFSVFGEVEGNRREFDAPAQSDKIRRDGTGQRYRAGVDFGAAGKTVRGEVSLGWGEQETDDHRLEAASTTLLDANLAYRMSDLNSLLFTAQTEIYDTTGTKSAFVPSHTAGVELRHAFTEYLIGSAGMALTYRNYTSEPIEETELRTTLGAEYFINREVVLFGRYQHIAFDSSSKGADYDADDIRVGVKLRR